MSIHKKEIKMIIYNSRKTIPEEEQIEIFGEIQHQLQQIELTRKKLKRKRIFVKPIKLA